jgi:6-pyruvoyltetrahydropterin/6-carboxytetrahydropterin synthase
LGKFTMDLYVEFSFSCSHHLPLLDGPGARAHEHQYRLLVTVTGQPDPTSGTIMNFGELRRIVNDSAVAVVNHRDLNQLMENPTAENLTHFLWDRLEDKVPGLSELRLWETPEYSVSMHDWPLGKRPIG